MNEYPVDRDLDLHVFDPSDGGDLTPVYLPACHEKGTPEVRINRKRLRGFGQSWPRISPARTQPAAVNGTK